MGASRKISPGAPLSLNRALGKLKIEDHCFCFITLKLVFTASLLDSVENKPASLLVVGLGKVAYLAGFPHLCVVDTRAANSNSLELDCFCRTRT